MKILLTVLMTALSVFALATAWVDYVQPRVGQSTVTVAAPAMAVAEVPVTKKRNRKPVIKPDTGLVPVPTGDDAALSVAGPVPAAADVRQLAERLDEVKIQESRLAARQEELRLIYEDIRTELSVVGELRKRTSDDLAEAERRGLKSEPLAATSPAPKARTAPSPARAASANGANRGTALILRRLVDEGKMETAVSMLKSMKQRDAAGVLETLESTDSKLADRLAISILTGRDETIRR